MATGTQSPQSRLLRLLQVERNDLWVAVIYSVAIGLLTLVLPIATQSLVNTIALGNLLQPLLLLTGLVLATRIVSAILQSLRIWVVEMMQRRILVRVSSDTINRLLRAPADAFDKHHGPELVNRFFDVVTLQKSGASLLVDGLSVGMQTVMGMILLAVYHPWLLAFDFLLLGAILIVIFPMGRGAVVTSVNESKAKYALVAWLQETARYGTAFRSPAGMTFALDRTDRLVGDYLKYRSSHFRILLRQIGGSLGIHAVASAALLGVGGWLVIERQLTLGQLVAAEIVVELVLSGFSKLGKHLELYYDMAAAVDKLGYLQDLPLERTGTDELPRVEKPAAVRLRDVTFRYNGGAPVLEQANWDVKPGRRIGLLGHSGRGKSTVLNLLYGSRSASGGIVEIDGIDLRELRRADLRGQVAIVSAPEIFEGTIEDNMRIGCQGLSNADMRLALAQVGLLDEVLALPDGLETRLATGGMPLSHGQSVRLALARAIVSQPRLLMIDEALDQIGDARELDGILAVLFAAEAPWTLIVATAKPQLIERCDEVYEVGKAELVHVR